MSLLGKVAKAMFTFPPTLEEIRLRNAEDRLRAEIEGLEIRLRLLEVQVIGTEARLRLHEQEHQRGGPYRGTA